MGIDGAFNVNSVSVRAWSAALASLGDPNVDAFSPDTGGTTALDFENPHFRFSRILSGSSGEDPEWFAGHFDFTRAEIRSLAEEIVAEVRRRGPFANLADFVNRRLADDETGRAGAVQAAIDASGINDAFASGFSLGEANANFPVPGNAASSQGDSVTGHLSQADLLQSLGPILTTRGDTFRIRAYGEAPGALSGAQAPRAYLEAVVQRVPSYVDPSNPPDTPPSEEEASDRGLAELSAANARFGRSYRIVRLEWMSESTL
jgi:hypothetical protein